MAKQPVQPQGELFTAETTWFHVFKDMIDSGDMAKLSGSAVKVYLTVKSYTNFSTGRAFPALNTIAEKTGCSERQVMRCLEELQDAGYIEKQKKGRSNLYTLREKINITDEHGRPQAVATWDYLPSSVRDSVADLKNVLVTGDFAGAKIVQIENLHVNINNAYGESHQVNLNITNESLERIRKTDPELAEKLLSIKEQMDSLKGNR